MEKELKLENIQAPFNVDDLIESNIAKNTSRKFYELKNNPEKIIRVESFEYLKNLHNNKLEVVELVGAAKLLYKELEEKYGILVPADFFIGKDKEENDVVYSVTDKITGENLGDVKNSKEFVAKIENLYTSVAKYFFDKYKEDGLYLSDINAQSQYIYGKKHGEQEDKIYLIDTDIWLSNSHTGIYLVVYWFTRHMSGLEKQFKTQFKNARDYVNQFINQPLPENINEEDMKNVDAIKKFLNNEKSDYNPKSGIPDFE